MVIRIWFTAVIILAGALRLPICGAEPATFVRGVNLHGPSLTIDDHAWEDGESVNVRCHGKAFENQQVVLRPQTDAERSRMLRSSRWGSEIDVDLLNLPDGDYQICLYVWEDNNSAQFDVLVNHKTVLTGFASGTAGSWKRLGPWQAKSVDRVIRISARGGDANLSGIEIWSGAGAVPNPMQAAFNVNPTVDELAFFENKIRPVFIGRCYACHSQDSEEIGGNLLLDSRSGIIKGGDTEPPIIPGNPEASLLIRAIKQTDPDLKMPPEGKLSAHEIADLEQWIRFKAPDPRTEDSVPKRRAKTAIDWDRAKDFWSLKPLNRPHIPTLDNDDWPAGDVDRLILAKLESQNLHPPAESRKEVLLRRVTFDLTGLPPSPEEQAAFEADVSPLAFAKVVDRLLESPRYGERWGRHWMDVVRYADTAGDNSDFPIPQIYLYRNWVIDAFNRDLPYDQFVREQLAGDLIEGGTPEERQQRIIATGYLANARRFGSRVSDYPWHLTIEDTLDNLGRTFLATTINCARCHHHKFDPVTTDDYYGLYGIFQSTRYPWPGIELEQKQRDLVPLIAAEDAGRITDEHRRHQEELDAKVRDLEKKRDATQGDERKNLDKQVGEARQQAERHAHEELPFAQAYAVAEAAAIRNAAIQIKGDPTKTGPVVPRHFPMMLGGAGLLESDKTSGRLQLANWIVDPTNPLTARVMANRIWMYHFGKGLVATPNDFGRQGKPPTNPELLDYLASEFIASGWSIKSMHRQILLSKTYRMSGDRAAEADGIDPANELFSRFPRRRLDAESLRDTLLLLGGHLDVSPGGPHPFPPQTEWKFTQHSPFKAVYESNRRSVYLMTQRIQRHPYLAIFDGADPAASTPLRLTSTTPLQALYLLNDAFVHEQAAGLAQQLLSQSGETSTRLERAYRLLFCRSADADELESATQFLGEITERMIAANVPADQIQSLSWQALMRTLFRLNEFTYLD